MSPANTEIYSVGDPQTADAGCVVFAKHVLSDLGTPGLPYKYSPMFKVCTDPICGPKNILYRDLKFYDTPTLSYVHLGAGTKVELYDDDDIIGEMKAFAYSAASDNVINLTKEKFSTSRAHMNDAVRSIRVSSTSSTKVSK